MPNIFISYNPRVETEQSLAIRLQTLGSLYGLSVSLPDRIGTASLKVTTKERIRSASIFLVFSTRNLTKNIKDEIEFARTLKKKIIVVYDKDIGRSLNISGVKEIEYNHKIDSPEKIITEIKKALNRPTIKTARRKSTATKTDDALDAFLLVGLGLLLLAAFTSKDK